MKFTQILLVAASTVLFAGCGRQMEKQAPYQFVTLDPGHFHAGLVQKSMYPDVDSIVHVYAPEGNDVNLYLSRIESYNARPESPTRWKEVVYSGQDFFEKMIAEKKGNIVVLAGNNQKKTEYILESIKAGFNVYADKPMVITGAGFPVLKEAFKIAEEKKLLLYDIMTERYEITTILQRELSMMPSVFGSLKKGSADTPAITKESIHHFYKEVSGKPLQRPAWFYDVTQEGEGIVDVTTHLVDLVQWEAFPEQVIDYEKDIKIINSRRWATSLSLPEFTASTAATAFPDYLNKYVDTSGHLKVTSNGEVNYQIKGIYARVGVIWNYKAEPGAGDTHYSIMRGSNCDLVIRQGKEQGFIPKLYIEKINADSDFEKSLKNAMEALQEKFPGIGLAKSATGWEISIPESYREGHEAHFARVTEKYLSYLKSGGMPAWEVPNMLAKYYTTTKALALSVNQ
jgi:predicted dehydrogenase